MMQKLCGGWVYCLNYFRCKQCQKKSNGDNRFTRQKRLSHKFILPCVLVCDCTVWDCIKLGQLDILLHKELIQRACCGFHFLSLVIGKLENIIQKK